MKIKIRGTHILLVYPIALVLSFYAVWLAGRVSLGYWPRPHIDDPKYIEGFWMWTYYLPALLELVLPIALFWAALSAIQSIRKALPGYKIYFIQFIAGFILLWVAIAFLRWDPLRVIEWYID